MAMPSDLSPPATEAHASLRSFRQWTIAQALPLWASAGFDRAYGGFHECLFRDGEPDATAPRRTMVQARQIYVYAHAAALGWHPQGLPLAQRALETLLVRARAADGRPGYVYSVSPNGGIADPTRDTYTQAFVILALAWLYRASGDAQLRGLIDEALAFVDEHLTAPDGTLYEGVPRRLPRRQNPHMHLYEAMLALHEVADHPEAAARAERLRTQPEDRFLDPQTRTLGEFFDDAWRPQAESDVVEPGHHAEWAWLLHRHACIAGRAPEPLAAHFLAFAAGGADPETGFVFDGVSRSGAPRLRSRRVWPQTELAKAWLAAHERGHAGAIEAADRILDAVSRRYLAVPVPGGWIDKFDEAGAPIGNTMPASTLYHLFSAAAETHRVLSATNAT
jgi:mannose-6-phosphate isomerase